MEEEVLLSFEDDVFDFDEKDKRILLCLGTFSVTLKAIRRAGCPVLILVDSFVC